jgi:HD superfamily phosphohydrolase
LGLLPVDKIRALLILEHFEAQESLLSTLNLDARLLQSLLIGHCPWPQYGWIVRLIEGQLDVDRVSYVAQDSVVAKGQPLGHLVIRVARSLIHDGPAQMTIIDSAGVESAQEFLLNRGRLYVNVYQHASAVTQKRPCVVTSKAAIWKGCQTTTFIAHPRSAGQGILMDAR